MTTTGRNAELVRNVLAPAPMIPREPQVRPWRRVRRRLAVRLDGAGDVLMTTPALRALRARRPDEHLALLTSPAGAAAGELLPEVDEVIVYEPPWMPGRGSTPRPEADLAMLERLRAGRYDGAVIFTVHSQSALPAAMLCHLAGIPRRLGHSLANPYGLLTDWIPEPEPYAPARHETRRQLDLLAAVGVSADEPHLSLHVPDTAARRIRALLTRHGFAAGEPFLLLHPGAAAPSRRWPAERFAETARVVGAATGHRTVVAGGRADAPAARTIAESVGCGTLDLAGRLAFAEFAALVARAPLLLANNSSPAHIAAAVGTPVAVVYAMTNIQHAPWMVASRVVSSDVPCAGCRRSVCPLEHHRCMLEITPAAVADAVLDLWAETQERAAEAAVGETDAAGAGAVA